MKNGNRGTRRTVVVNDRMQKGYRYELVRPMGRSFDVGFRPQLTPKRMLRLGAFGGKAVLELARSGAELAGVVSFHGGLDAPKAEDASPIKAKVLVLTGADDRSVPPTLIATFEDEMRQAKADYQINIYGGAVHAFTNPANGSDPSTNVAYDAAADKRSWQAMRDFFAEIFAPPPVRH